MQLLPFLLALLAMTAGASPPEPRPERQDYDVLRAQAEAHYAEGSYELAHRAYLQAAEQARSVEEERWVAFRLADCSWRQLAATSQTDSQPLEVARDRLQELLALWKRPEERDETWAAVQSSLGDWHWTRKDIRNWSGASRHYLEALGFWARSADIERAREAYLSIVHRILLPEGTLRRGGSAWVGYTPPEVLDNAARIAVSDLDRAWTHYFLAQRLQRSGGAREHERVRSAYGVVLAIGSESPWYDEALFGLAVWTEERGIQKHDAARGTWTEPDFVGALELYRRFLREFPAGRSAWRDQVVRRVENITRTHVAVSVGQAFLPGSLQRFHLRWRNARAIELSLHALDLAADVRMQTDHGAGSWLESVAVERLVRVRSWTYATGDDGSHRWGEATPELEEALPPGAYVLRATADGVVSQDVLLVSDAGLVLKSHEGRLVVWCAGVRDGAPIAGARVRVYERDQRRGPWRTHDATTDEQGLALIELGRDLERVREVFVAAVFEDRQTFGMLQGPYQRGPAQRWQIQAHTDRAAYRPGQTVSWKIVARERVQGALATPAGRTLGYELRNPRGELAAEGSVELNRFGSAWGSFEPKESWPLGEYSLQLFLPKLDKEDRNDLSGATLFRLEEYKLPEFVVRVELPEDEDGRPRSFRGGETVSASVAAEYYFGGPVAEASVEVLVYQKPFFHRWAPPREFPWFYEDQLQGGRDHWGGSGQLVQRETLQTDAEGRALVSFDTPVGTQQDYEYTIEARVTDSSRREVAGSGTLKVTRQSYYVYATLEHELHRPGGVVAIDFRALDANSNPREVSGEAALIRRRWREVWLDPLGRPVEGEELARLRAGASVFPPPGGGPPWKLREQRYEEETVATTLLTTDAEGKARWSVGVPREGYYVVRWSSSDEGGLPIQAETPFWVADETTREIGFRQPGVKIIADRDTFRAGEPGFVMLATPASGRSVLFAVESEDLIELRVVKLDGTVKLLRLEVDARWVPNVQLTAHTFSDGYAHSDALEIVVPPEEHFLELELELSPAELLPGTKGALTVVARDRRGEPVEAELSLALVDEALSAIQGDYAVDPRQFFFGDKRPYLVATGVSALSYAMLVEGEEKGVWRDARELVHERKVIEEGPESFVVFQEGDMRMRALGKEGARMERGGMVAPGAADDFAAGRMVGTAAAVLPSSATDATGDAGAEIQVRSDFRETALWSPAVVTGVDGRATVEIDYPDSLTNWKAVARANSDGARFGIGRGASVTRKPLVVRLQAPRFFIVGDEVTLSVNLNNRTDESLVVRPELSVEGLRLLGFLSGGELKERAPDEVIVPARGEWRLDWRARAEVAGEARFVARAVAEGVSDAVERKLPVVAHGIEVLEARAGRSEADEIELALALPAARDEASTRFTVDVTPSLAVTMLDALPYLVDYPYGCTEQTLSRFLPAVIVKHTLEEQGLSPEIAMQRVFGGIEREHAGETQRATKGSLAALDVVVRAGLDRLIDYQRGDGGWSWWKQGEDDPFMTAYVVWGLSLARDAGVDVPRDVLARGARRLALLLTTAEHSPDLAAWMLHGLSAWLPETGADEERGHAKRAFDTAYSLRGALNAYGRSLLALSAVRMGRAQEAQVLARNLIDGAIVDRQPDASIVQRGGAQGGTASARARWGEDGIHRRWSDGGVEATAFALRALLAIDPTHELIEPAAQWLLANRRGAQWSNTRDTAIVVLALGDYLRQRKELDRTVEYELLVNGHSIARRRLSGDEMLAAPARHEVPLDLLRSGANEVLIKKLEGPGPLYFSAQARFFSLEEPIPPRGNELFVRRQYFRLAGKPTLLAGYVYERVPLTDGLEVESGERVEVVLTMEAKTALEYLVFEDHKPAGLEATLVKSGEALSARELRRSETEHRFGEQEAERPGVGRRVSGPPEQTGYTGRSRRVHQELRDQKVAVFVDRLPEGVWELRYDLRAEVPGRFHALPLVGHAMYVPEIRGNSAELRLIVRDRGGASD